MAIALEAWETDGEGHTLMVAVRSDQPGYNKKEFVDFYKKHRMCTLITERRTEKKEWEKILYEFPNQEDAEAVKRLVDFDKGTAISHAVMKQRHSPRRDQ